MITSFWSPDLTISSISLIFLGDGSKVKGMTRWRFALRKQNDDVLWPYFGEDLQDELLGVDYYLGVERGGRSALG